MAAIDELLSLMARLRDPQHGCPWDRAQTYASLVPHTLEEAYEVADAVQRQDAAALCDELGDLLFQIVFYARLAQEAGHFTFEDIVRALLAKLHARHPFLRGEAELFADAAAQHQSWEAHKAAARATRVSGVLAEVSLALPALVRAQKLQNRAARVGFDWPDIEPVLAKLDEELAELRAELTPVGQAQSRAARIEDEIGDVLFVAVNLARHRGLDAEAALRRANAKFERRFAHIEQALAAQGRLPQEADLAEMDALWDAAKQLERALDGQSGR